MYRTLLLTLFVLALASTFKQIYRPEDKSVDLLLAMIVVILMAFSIWIGNRKSDRG